MICIICVSVTGLEFLYSKSAVSGNIGIPKPHIFGGRKKSFFNIRILNATCYSIAKVTLRSCATDFIIKSNKNLLFRIVLIH